MAMELKRKNSAPTPRKVRARLPQITRNPVTGRPMCDTTMQTIFATKCYDESEDDPWQYLDSPSQDMLPSELLPLRVGCGRHILRMVAPGGWYNHVAIDPCYTFLPKSLQRLEELQVKAMGKRKWMSSKCKRRGNNLRAPATARSQGGADVTRADWTPVFARGKLRIFVCDPSRSQRDPQYPSKLNDAANLAKFVRNVLPGILLEMQEEHNWPNVPRTVVHDKASYMVTSAHDRLQQTFAAALTAAGFCSWVGGASDSTKWLVKKWGDVYLHETVISHIRRLLDDDFACRRLGETVPQFTQRMHKVADYMNSPAFAATDGRGLQGLAAQLHTRCQWVVRHKGQRYPK